MAHPGLLRRLGPSTKWLAAGLAALLAAALPLTWLWGFTVDDALISARVAHQIALGRGYRFNSDGPVVDAVTPLGWAYVLAPFAKSSVLGALAAAKWLGAVSWLAASAWFGVQLARVGRRALALGIGALACTLPLAAWAPAGMETGLVLALATYGLAPGWSGRAALGLVAALRPELLPWVVVITLGDVLTEPAGVRERARAGALALLVVCAPFVCVAGLRLHYFGAAYPLAVLAKPADGAAGLRYALGALALSGPAWLLVAGRQLTALSARARVRLLAALVHLAVLVAVGGDWMPLYRLFVPVLPSLIACGAELAERAVWWATLARGALAASASALLAFGVGVKGRRVSAQREALIARAAPALRGATRVAALDVGWVGAATDAHVVDLAGVTDPSVARLSGGHTSKRLPEDFLEARAIDALVLLAESPVQSAWPELAFARRVEARISGLPGSERFRAVLVVPLLFTAQGYVVARREPTP